MEMENVVARITGQVLTSFVLLRPTYCLHFDVPSLYPAFKETLFLCHLSYAWQEMDIVSYHLGKVQRNVEQTRGSARDVLIGNHLRQHTIVDDLGIFCFPV